MTYQDPYASPKQSTTLTTNSRPTLLNWLLMASIFTIAHGLLNWWSVHNVPGGFWVMEGGNETAVERLAELLTLLLNIPSMLFCYVWYEIGYPGFSFTEPALAIANSCLHGAALALLVVYFGTKKRTPSQD